MKNFVCHIEPCRRIFCLLCLFFFSFFFSPSQIRAIKVGDMPIGAVIQLGDYKFLKITSRGLFVTLNPYPAISMQEFTSALCNNLTVCQIGDNCRTNGSTMLLFDNRDGKTYRVRKFADGNCWMIDNLAYGGGTDGSSDYCSNKTAWRDAIGGADYVSASATNGLNPVDGSRNTLVGDCRGNINTSNPGYWYNWVAAIQNTAGWGGCTGYNTGCTTNSFQPDEPTQGICPDGWQLPTGRHQTGDFYQLYLALGGNITGGCISTEASPDEDCVRLANNFNNPNYFNHLYVMTTYRNGKVGGNGTYYWSSTQNVGQPGHAQNLYFSLSYLGRVASFTNDPKNLGFLVRCLFSP